MSYTLPKVLVDRTHQCPLVEVDLAVFVLIRLIYKIEQMRNN